VALRGEKEGKRGERKEKEKRRHLAASRRQSSAVHEFFIGLRIGERKKGVETEKKRERGKKTI